MATDFYRLHGSLASPYSMKMRAVLRYRRLPHLWVTGGNAAELARKHTKAPVIPVLEYPDGSFKNDSTPLIFDLERRHPDQRSLIPDRASDAFLAYLFEDFADEWLTKSMFHYRWFRPRDQEQMSHWIMFDAAHGGGRERINAMAQAFRDRQVGRMALVGCTPENQALIETSTKSVLSALEQHVADRFTLFGTRPSMAEFGIFGQLSQLGVDPTAQEMMRADFPYTYRWLATVDDMSGWEGAWREPGQEHFPIVSQLLNLVGRYYLPFLVANAAALAAGHSEMRFAVDDMAYAQQPFKYQAKCLTDLRVAYAALPEDAKAELSSLLETSACLETLTAALGNPTP